MLRPFIVVVLIAVVAACRSEAPKEVRQDRFAQRERCYTIGKKYVESQEGGSVDAGGIGRSWVWGYNARLDTCVALVEMLNGKPETYGPFSSRNLYATDVLTNQSLGSCFWEYHSKQPQYNCDKDAFRKEFGPE